MQISRIDDQLIKAQNQLQTFTKKAQVVEFFCTLLSIGMAIFKGLLKKNRARIEENVFYMLSSSLLIDCMKLGIGFLAHTHIKRKAQNPYVYKVTYGKENSDLITHSHFLKISHTVNAYFIGLPIVSIATFLAHNSSMRTNPTAFFHPSIMSLTLIEFIRHISFYSVWKKMLNEGKILDELDTLTIQDAILRVQNENVIIALEKNTEEDMIVKTAYEKQDSKHTQALEWYAFHPFLFASFKLVAYCFFHKMGYQSASNIGVFWDSLGSFFGSLHSWRILYLSKSRGDLKKVGDEYNRNIALKTFLEKQRNKFVRIDYNPHAHAVICKNLKIANSPLHVAKQDSYNVEQIVQDQLNKDSILEVDEMYFSPGVTLLYSKNNQVNATFFKALNDQWIHMGGRTPKTQCQITMPCSKHEEILYLPKNTFLPLYRTLLEAIIYPRTLNSFQDKKSLLSKVEALMHQLDLSNLSKTLMTKKSTWDTITSRQLKRLLLIRAILFNPKVLCLGGLIDNAGDYVEVMINLLKKHLPNTIILISSTDPDKNLKNTTTAYVHDKLLSFSKPCLDNTTHHATFLDKTLWNSKGNFSGRKLKATP